ncbi:MAG: lasso peptide biosynthesis protein [Eubacteriales bacterium]|nr:lasso peptide biosynthesis protein [Eubacteriales bacterium]
MKIRIFRQAGKLIILSGITVLVTAFSAVAEAAVLEPGLEDASVPDTGAETVSMFRMYNPNSGEHFYTGNPAEKEMLLEKGWVYEGIGWKAPAFSNVPVYRLYNPNAGDHHYTTVLSEKAFLENAGWQYEGIAFYSCESDGNRQDLLAAGDGTVERAADGSDRVWSAERKTSAVPLFREYNPRAESGAHNYTSSSAEHENLIRLGWQEEGIAWYGEAGKDSESEWPEAEVFLREKNITTLREAFDYASGYRWVFYDVDPSLGTHYYAMKGYQAKEGNCYVDAGLFCEMANALGYSAVQIGGIVPRRDGSLAAHSWVEIDGRIYDPEYRWEYKREGGYAVIPGTPGSLRYQAQYRMSSR